MAKIKQIVLLLMVAFASRPTEGCQNGGLMLSEYDMLYTNNL